jgi:hypothetical protein
MVRLRQAIVVGVAMVLVAACSGDDSGSESGTTTTTEPSSITTLAVTGGGSSGTTATTASTTTTTTEPPALSIPQYRIVSRESGESGDTVVVLLDPTTYESLSDVDIHNVMSDLVEEYAPVYEAHLVDTQAAADDLFVENPTPDQQAELDKHYLARLEEGFRIVYLAEFADLGVAILGS